MPTRVRIVIPGDDPPQLQSTAQLDRLRNYGDVALFSDRPASDVEKIERCRGAACLINSRSAVKWPAPVLERLPDLKMITVCGIGTDAIETEAARKLGIIVCNIPAQTAPIVAEHALGLMFAVARGAWYQTDLVKPVCYQYRSCSI